MVYQLLTPEQLQAANTVATTAAVQTLPAVADHGKTPCGCNDMEHMVKRAKLIQWLHIIILALIALWIFKAAFNR